MKNQIITTSVSGIDLEYHKVESNKIWKFIQPYFESTFGELAEFEYSRVIDERKLLECFVEDFYQDALEMIENAIDSKIILTDGHIERNYQDIKGVENVNNSLKQYQEIILLLGDIGVGKTTFIGKLITDNKNSIFFININLRNKRAIPTIDETIVTEIKETIINQFENFIVNNGLNIKDAQEKIFENDRRIIEHSLPSIEPKRLQKEFIKEITRILSLPKLHLRRISHYLREQNIKTCIVLDGADFIDDVELQRYVYRTAKSLSEECHCNIILSLRETSIPKANRRIAEFEVECVRFHLFPPRAKPVLEKRTNYLINQLNSLDESLFESYPFSKNDLANFSKSLFDSVKLNIKEFEYLSNFSIRATLDLYRCIACSGHLSESDLNSLMTGKVLTWHKVINALVLYAWEYYNSEVHLIVNLYDDNEIIEPKGQNLIMIRILQMIEYLSQSSNNKDHSANIGMLLANMKRIGYEKERVLKSIEKLFNGMLIDSPDKEHRMFNKNISSLKLTMCGYYYLHTLIFTLRYIQGVMYATHCSKSIATELIKEAPDAANRIVQTLLFVSYIKDMEILERKDLSEENIKLIEVITGNKYLTNVLLENIEKEIDTLSIRFPEKSISTIQTKLSELKNFENE